MKTENNHSSNLVWRQGLSISAAIILMASMAIEPAKAQNPSSNPVPVMPAMASGQAMLPPPNLQPPMPMMIGQQAMGGMQDQNDNKMNKGLRSAEDHAPDMVKSAAKNLDSTASNFTLDDLNSARQALTRLEVLIELEKRMNELEKIRAERATGSKLVALANSIPASALTPPPSIKQAVAHETIPAPAPVRSSIELVRITGSEGYYTAMLRVNGTLKMMRTGDKLSDGRYVRQISSSSVEISGGEHEEALQIRDVKLIHARLD